MFLTIEGLGGVGKTSIVSIISREHNFDWYRVSSCISDVKSIFADERDIDARYLMFLSALMHSSVRIQKLCMAGHNVIVDGYIYRTIAYHVGMGARLKTNAMELHFKPDLSILLMCDNTVLTQRRLMRSRPPEYWDEYSESRAAQITSEYQRYSFPNIDTSNLAIDEVCSKVLSLCESKGLVLD